MSAGSRYVVFRRAINVGGHVVKMDQLRALFTSESTFSGAQLEKTHGMPATLRNVTTVRKLGVKCAPAR
jgi:uncharacterized protein (DUF1697 family)